VSVRIKSVEAGSKAEAKGISAGDTLVSINGHEINDVLDYQFYLKDKKVIISLKSGGGKGRIVIIRKDESDDIGLEFETYLMDKQHSCTNKCIFCFVDQLPEGLRDSLYFKDDDSRLSFLFGNYVTLTNLDDAEVERIIRMHISPVNISVHTMNPELRVMMMKNPRSGECLKYIKKFTENGIKVNAQLVLCPGINDGSELEYSLRELFRLGENIESVACVPVGLSKHREKLYPLKPYTKETAGEVIDTIDRLNREDRESGGKGVAYAADEFYIYAQRQMPSAEYYGDFPQLENGVGMWTLLRDEFIEALDECDITELDRHVSLVTGTAAFPLMKELAAMAEEKIKKLKIDVYEVKNRLFGESITVSGLITGGDIVYTLKEADIGEELIIPPNCLRREGDMFLDNMTVDELSEKTGVKITQNGPGGADLLSSFIGEQ
jgi:putative radical SAM enzyme (TIGR03279 family)